MEYTTKQKEEMFNKVIDYISNGMPLRKALKQPDVFSQKVWDKLVKEENKGIQYMRACEERADAIFEEIIEIADNSGNDKKIIEGGVEVTNHEAIQRDRLRVDARKWAASKMNPKKYGDKLDIEGNININKFDVGFGEDKD